MPSRPFGLLLALGLAAALGSPAAGAGPTRLLLESAPAPVDNPLKGLVPYAGGHAGGFPHSMEFSYLPLSDLVTGDGAYEWSPLDRLLDEVAGRGHQAVFRVYLEYPGKPGAVPAFLKRAGLKSVRWKDEGSSPAVENETPDYADPRLRRALTRFIAALGRRYDGDPRIGFITAGLLGEWGEWHDSPRSDLFAGKPVQTEIMDAYEAAFARTRILLRYPAGDSDGRYAPNARRRFGYHDDSFAWATLDTGRPEDAWFFGHEMKSAGEEALNKWKSQPIGGEIRPEAWGLVFDQKPGRPEIQDFGKCVEATHATWLMDSGMFGGGLDSGRVVRASAAVRRMGYEFAAGVVSMERRADGTWRVTLEFTNRGVAPFYYDWPAEFGLLRAGAAGVGSPMPKVAAAGKIHGLLPGERRTWDQVLDFGPLSAGDYKLLLRIPNPMPGGRPVRFANKSQDADAPGWLTLGDAVVP